MSDLIVIVFGALYLVCGIGFLVMNSHAPGNEAKEQSIAISFAFVLVFPLLMFALGLIGLFSKSVWSE